MLQTIILNYPKGKQTIYDQSQAETAGNLKRPEYAESIRVINDLIWSLALLEQDYEIDIKITPKKPGAGNEALFQILNHNPKLMGITRHIAEKKVFPEACAIEKLTTMQKKIVMQVRKGLTYTQIAKKLCISPHTVNGHRKNAMKVLGVSQKTSLISLLERFGID
jgi:DNA-binding CsgD family transcriptional regulator